MCGQHVPAHHRELPSPGSVLFRAPVGSHVIDGQTEAWGGCRALIWVPLVCRWWGLGSVLGLLCQS